jgi:hypothetical protein
LLVLSDLSVFFRIFFVTYEYVVCPLALLIVTLTGLLLLGVWLVAVAVAAAAAVVVNCEDQRTFARSWLQRVASHRIRLFALSVVDRARRHRCQLQGCVLRVA